MSIFQLIRALGRRVAESIEGPLGRGPGPLDPAEGLGGDGRSRSHRFGLGLGPASGLGTILVLASLALACGPARADSFRVEGQIHVDDLLIRGGYEQHGPGGAEAIARVPRHGLDIDLWSDPDPGAFVRVGDGVQLFFRTNVDCYVTLLSIDPDGRARRLFPRRGDDGWVRGGRVQALPGRWDDYDLRFTGPVGEEYVFAVASLDPLPRYYPAWLGAGFGVRWDECNYRYGRSDLFDTGWCVGDPLPEIHRFTERLVPFPHRRDTYAAAWIRFEVGRRHMPVWRVCNDCGGLIGHGHDCGHGFIEIHIGIGRGVCDFYAPRPLPRWRHVVCRTEEPRRWDRVFREPVGRWRSPRDIEIRDRAPSPSREIGRRDRSDPRSGSKEPMTVEEYRAMREREGNGKQRVDRSRERGSDSKVVAPRTPERARDLDPRSDGRRDAPPMEVDRREEEKAPDRKTVDRRKDDRAREAKDTDRGAEVRRDAGPSRSDRSPSSTPGDRSAKPSRGSASGTDQKSPGASSRRVR